MRELVCALFSKWHIKTCAANRATQTLTLVQITGQSSYLVLCSNLLTTSYTLMKTLRNFLDRGFVGDQARGRRFYPVTGQIARNHTARGVWVS